MQSHWHRWPPPQWRGRTMTLTLATPRTATTATTMVTLLRMQLRALTEPRMTDARPEVTTSSLRARWRPAQPLTLTYSARSPASPLLPLLPHGLAAEAGRVQLGTTQQQQLLLLLFLLAARRRGVPNRRHRRRHNRAALHGVPPARPQQQRLCAQVRSACARPTGRCCGRGCGRPPPVSMTAARHHHLRLCADAARPRLDLVWRNLQRPSCRH